MLRWFLLAAILSSLALTYAWYRVNREANVSSPFLTEWADYGPFPWLPQGEAINLPRDHGVHENVPLEHWQIQGILVPPDGEKVAFQFDLFAITFQMAQSRRPSAWASRRIFLGHFALTDPKTTDRFRYEHREEREALALSRAKAGLIEIDDWKLEFAPSLLRLHAGARGNYLVLDLTADPMIPIADTDSTIIHGYQLPRLTAWGRYGKQFVTGTAWMEHAWGRLPLPGNAISAARLRLQMKEGLLSCLRLKRRNGVPSGLARCSISDTTGRSRSLPETRLTALSHWRSPEGKVYPVSWHLEGQKINLKIEAAIPEQVMTGPFSLWSGWVSARGKAGELGEGFMQVTEVKR